MSNAVCSRGRREGLGGLLGVGFPMFTNMLVNIGMKAFLAFVG